MEGWTVVRAAGWLSREPKPSQQRCLHVGSSSQGSGTSRRQQERPPERADEQPVASGCRQVKGLQEKFSKTYILCYFFGFFMKRVERPKRLRLRALSGGGARSAERWKAGSTHGDRGPGVTAGLWLFRVTGRYRRGCGAVAARLRCSY